MKLELKHLAPYLPYGLDLHTDINVYSQHFGMTRINTELSIKNIEKVIDFIDSKFEYDKEGFDDYENSYCKPILRPLSDLTDEELSLMGVNKEWYGFDDWKENHIGMSVPEYNYLIENHFDVFGLIDAGLAIDINTLNHE